jgi:hypothetical protein
MGRAIIVMVSTLLFGIFGAVVASLNVQALIQANSGNTRLTDSIALSFTLGPLIGAAVGGVLSFAMLATFESSPPSNNENAPRP